MPWPWVLAASMNRMSPPTGVQARPVATPGTAVRMATSLSNRGGPSTFSTSASVMRTWLSPPSAIRIAALRKARPISRSSARTPASRV